MPIVPLRNMGAAGVVTDTDPFDLPVNSYSFATNVRFNAGRVERGSVFRTMGTLAGNVNAKHLLSYTMTSGGAQTLILSRLGAVMKWDAASNTTTAKSPAGYTPQTTNVQITSCVLNNVVYLNRPDRLPWYRSKDSDGDFQVLPTAASGTAQWRPDWRARVLRSLKGVLIAANITKGAQQFPNTVKWSNFSTELNMLPPDWDYASTTSNAGENTLAEMESPIVDAFPLSNRMYLYGEGETHMMEFIGGNDMFRFERQFDKGVIGVNCVVEVGGVHYVFGSNDLWIHDGTGQQSIATEKVRDFVFNGLIKARSDSFFVTYNPRTNEVIFCYASNDKHTKWDTDASPDGCNRAAIFNTVNKTWSFADLPYITCAAHTIPLSGVSFDASAPVTYQSVGGSFSSLESERKLNLTVGAMLQPGFDGNIFTFEPFREGVSSYPLSAMANAGAYLEREGIDMDELKASLRGYKLVSSIYPQGRLDPDAQPLVFTFGTSDHPTESPQWGPSQTFDKSFYKLDFNQAGRFLSLKITQNDFQWFSLSGMDLDVVLLGDF